MFGAPLYIVIVSESNPPGFVLPVNINVDDGDQVGIHFTLYTRIIILRLRWSLINPPGFALEILNKE